MCRLLGMVSAQECGLPYWLVDAPNALREQAAKHPDGWGIASFQAGSWTLSRQPTPAHQDEQFVHRARAASGSAFVTHIRHASRGGLSLANTHPFLRDGWAFAHNGTITNDDGLRALVAPDMQPVGETDSEALFRLILTELREADPHYPCASAGHVCRCLLDVVPRLESRQGASFLLSDGANLFFYRERNTLKWLRPPGAALPMLLVASEAIGDGQWADTADGQGYVVDASLRIRTWDQAIGAEP